MLGFLPNCPAPGLQATPFQVAAFFSYFCCAIFLVGFSAQTLSLGKDLRSVDPHVVNL